MPSSEIVLVVDRNRRNFELMREVLQKENLEALGASSVEEMRQRIAEHKISLALIDLAGLGRDVWAVCEELRERSIPFVVISPRFSPEVSQEGSARGARGVLVKPLTVRELVGIVRGLLGN
ncbi:MAG: response regulator [candidate division KSB1 bacterium]|nr:response regulator [candidate division KSB1 bacterium]